jgi:hypothetical protein
MNTWRFPAFTLVLMYLGFLGGVVRSSFYLPTQVASHFNAAGEPDAWMPTENYLQFIALFGAVLPLVWVVLPQLLRFLPVQMINLPNRDYWLAPARRAQSLGWLARHFLWFACLQVGLAGGIHLVVFLANRVAPPQMSTPYMIVVIALFLVGAGGWVLTMVRHFQRGVPAGRAE